MKTYSFLLCFIIIGIFTSCQKESSNNNNNTPDGYYITFDFDSTPLEYVTNSYQVQSSNGAKISSGVVNFGGSAGVESIYIGINMDKDSIVYDDLKALEGQTLEVCLSSSNVCNLPLHIDLRYDDGNERWTTDATHNTAPAQFLKITKVEWSPNIGLGFGQLIEITGEFNLVLDASGTTKTASNGKFFLQFPEFK